MSQASSSDDGAFGPSSPDGDVYDWYQRGLQLLLDRHPDAVATLLARAAAVEPGSRSIREALARAEYDAGRYEDAIVSFTGLITINPTDDYAQFGLGLTLSRLGQFALAVEHLAMAVAMRPQRVEYVRALQSARATLRARQASG